MRTFGNRWVPHPKRAIRGPLRTFRGLTRVPVWLLLIRRKILPRKNRA